MSLHDEKPFDHSHCPFDHEHPQPVRTEVRREICGCCLVMHGVVTEMIPCTEAVCGKEVK